MSYDESVYIYIYIHTFGDATACLAAFNFAGEFDNECVAMAAFCTAFLALVS